MMGPSSIIKLVLLLLKSTTGRYWLPRNFSPLIKSSIVHILLFIDVSYSWVIFFKNLILKVSSYMDFLTRRSIWSSLLLLFIHNFQIIFSTDKSLYELKQVTRVWFHHCRIFLLSKGLIAVNLTCLYMSIMHSLLSSFLFFMLIGLVFQRVFNVLLSLLSSEVPTLSPSKQRSNPLFFVLLLKLSI